MSWVVATNDISPVEERLGRSSVEGSRKRPDGTELKWKQVGVLGTIKDSQLPILVHFENLSSNLNVRSALSTLSRKS